MAKEGRDYDITSNNRYVREFIKWQRHLHVLQKRQRHLQPLVQRHRSWERGDKATRLPPWKASSLGTMFTAEVLYLLRRHPWVLTEVSWLKTSSALMKKSRWKLVVNRLHKTTFNQVIFLTNWQRICGITKFLRGLRNLPDVIYFLLLH